MSDPASARPEYVGLTRSAAEAAVDLLCIPVFTADDALADVADIDRAVDGEWSRARSSGEFAHRLYETFNARTAPATWKARRVCFIAAGPPAELDSERIRRLAATGAYAAQSRAAESIGWLMRGPLWTDPAGGALEGLSAQAVVAVADGLSATAFDAGSYKREPARKGRLPSRCIVVAPGADATALSAAVRRGRIQGEAVNFARGLANEPGNVLTPHEFVARVSLAAGRAGLGCDVLDEHRLQELGCRLLLSVARGSAEPPYLMVLRHEPANAPESPVLALVGKGVTFDSGGISIKPAAGMERMKDDMSGGAAVAAAMVALAELRAPIRVIGIIPTVENMPGGRSMRPGDVVVGASGTSVEIVNTDAEGRLILADALWYARHLGATHVVDVATLTGACIIALGHTVAGLFGTPQAWVETVRTAAGRAGDRVWPLPIYEEARDQLKSEIADLVNAAGRPGGAITAAAFLREFAGGSNWAHLDIAGTAWAESRKPYQSKGATGAAVRTLVELGMRGEFPSQL
jgi:leucyl aminopeptidase